LCSLSCRRLCAGGLPFSCWLSSFQRTLELPSLAPLRSVDCGCKSRTFSDTKSIRTHFFSSFVALFLHQPRNTLQTTRLQTAPRKSFFSRKTAANSHADTETHGNAAHLIIYIEEK